MKHLELEAAVDFARGFLPGAQKTRIMDHLAQPCERCVALVAWAEAIAAIATNEPRFEPPAEVVQRAIEIFPTRAQATRFRERRLARLVFDSFREPLAAGIRSTERGTRQVMYRAGDVYVDLRLDYAKGYRAISIVGQIAERGAAPAHGKAVSVLLTDGLTVLARSPINEFGEFQLESAAARQLRLQIPLGAANADIEVPLARVLTADTRPKVRRRQR
jgi:hypothetical protein